jgi:hypothetical protein
LQSKSFNKHAAFKELFEIIFEFKLAYYDELRPFIMKGQNNQDDWGDFNKYEFLCQDADGKWYYNTDFTFESNVKEGLPRDKVWLISQAQALYTAKAMDSVALWTLLESVEFPMATELKKMAMEEKQQALQLAQQQIAMQSQVAATNQPSPQASGAQQQPQQPTEQQLQDFINSLPPEVHQFMASQPAETQIAETLKMMQMPTEELQGYIQNMLAGGSA